MVDSCITHPHAILLLYEEVINLVTAVIAHVLPGVVLPLREERSWCAQRLRIAEFTQPDSGIIAVRTPVHFRHLVPRCLRYSERCVRVRGHDQDLILFTGLETDLVVVEFFCPLRSSIVR